MPLNSVNSSKESCLASNFKLIYTLELMYISACDDKNNRMASIQDDLEMQRLENVVCSHSGIFVRYLDAILMSTCDGNTSNRVILEILTLHEKQLNIKCLSVLSFMTPKVS